MYGLDFADWETVVLGSERLPQSIDDPRNSPDDDGISFYVKDGLGAVSDETFLAIDWQLTA